MIKLENLSKNYGDFLAVDNINIEINQGELFGFLGPNGAGKTTTIKMMVGLLKPTGGRAVLGGLDIEKESVEAKRINGYVPDEPFLYDKLTGFEFLEFVADLWKVEKETKYKNIDKYLNFFELEDKRDHFIQSYSHGMRKKIALAAALVHEPKILYLDEPTVGLDPKSAKLMKELLKNFCQKGGTVFLSTHILEIAENLCSKVAIINKGKIIAQGTVEELKQQNKEASLEDIFLELTATKEDKDLLEALR